MISLGRRLSWGLTLSLVLLLGLQWAVVTYAIGQLVERQLIDRLQREGEGLLAGLHMDATGQMRLDETRPGARYQRPFSGQYYLIVSPQQRLASRSLWDAELAVPTLSPGQHMTLYQPGPARQSLLLAAHGYRKQQVVLTLVVAEDLTVLQQQLTFFRILYAALSLGGLAALLLLQRRIVQRALHPLHQVRQDMELLAHGEIEQLTVRGPQEVAPLLLEMNRLLAGMDKRTRRSREALGNLAHALKTQLARVNQVVEQHTGTTAPLRDELYAATIAMQSVIDRELKRARLLGDLRPGRQVDLPQEVGRLVDTLQKLFVDKTVQIDWQVDDRARFVGDREDLLELLGNLLENACKWCRHRVSVQVTSDAGLCVRVEDDGPGCMMEPLDALTRRGYRADESQPGSGLGLAIVRDIVESYSGSLQFSPSVALGGLQVEVRLAGGAAPGEPEP